MNDKEITIKLSDRKVADAKMLGEFNDSPLIIFVHGLFDHMDNVLAHEFSKYTQKMGCNFLRFNLYDWGPKARSISETSMEQHTLDLLDVIDFCMSKGASNIHLSGHSLGAYTVLRVRAKNVKSAILFDPSHPKVTKFSSVELVDSGDRYTLDFGVEYSVKKPYVNSIIGQKAEVLTSEIDFPVLILSAGKGVLTNGGEDYVNLLAKGGVAAKQKVISGADHSFTHNSSRDEAFGEVGKWLGQPDFS